jgi:prepilin-type N-terminal cleavage/methylation domain-containing protein
VGGGYKSLSLRSGFTIIELLIVIIVIAILATLVITAYNGVQKKAATSVVQADLHKAAESLATAQAETGTYPTSFPSDFKPSEKVTLNLADTGSPDSYCINGSYSGQSSIQWHYQTNGGLQSGFCSGQIIAGSDVGDGGGQNLITDPSFSNLSSWGVSCSGGCSVAKSVRNGTSSDPAGNRPVLVLQNNSPLGTAPSWSYFSGLVNGPAMVVGKNYTTSYYIRMTSGSGASFGVPGVMDTNATNVVINGGGITGVGSSWQQRSKTQNANINGLSSSRLYTNVGTPSLTSNWTVEIQNPRVVEN